MVALLAAAGVLAACGGENESVSSDEIVRESERSRRDRPATTQPRQRKVAADFERLAAGLDGSVGVAVGYPGEGRGAVLGRLGGGSAWSTIKVPLAMAVLERGASGAQRAQIERAITASDNAAADALYASLGSPQTAARAVTDVLRSSGDETTEVSSVGRDGFSPYGQTEWTLRAQHRFMASLAGGCFSRPAVRDYVLGLMGTVTSDSWGLGAVGGRALWKGGWGPGTDGRYLARQMGVVGEGGRRLVVTLAVLPQDGTFPSAQRLATEVARWAVRNGPDAAPSARRC